MDAEMDFNKMKRKQLQELCKKHAIPANLTNREMANRLLLLFQKPKELISHSQDSSSNVEEMDSETDPKVACPKVKKVRFSPNNETYIIACSDSESAASQKRRRRQPSRRSKTSQGVEDSTKIAGSPLRRRKSSTRTLAQADKEGAARVLSPLVGKRRAQRLSICVQNENAHNEEDSLVSNTRQLRSRAVVIDKNVEVVEGAKVNASKNGTQIDLKRRRKRRDGLSENGYQDMPAERTQNTKLMRQSERNTEKDIHHRLPVLESERTETSTRVTRSTFRPVQEAALVNADHLQGGVQGEGAKNSRNKDPPQRQSTDTGKSIAPSKGLPNEVAPLQNSNVVAESVSNVGNPRRSKRNKTRGRESLILSNEIASESDRGDSASIHQSKRGGKRIQEDQKKSDHCGDTSKIGSQLVESDVYAVAKNEEGEGDLNDRNSVKRANGIVNERRALLPEVDSACIEELPVRRSRRLSTMTNVLPGGEFQTNYAGKMIESQRGSRSTAFRQDLVANGHVVKKSTKAKGVQDMNGVLQEELPTDQLPRQSKRNPPRCRSFAASKKQKSSLRDHTGGDMTTPHGTPATEEVLELNILSPVQEVLDCENDSEMKCLKEVPDDSSRKEDEEETAVQQELLHFKGKKTMVNTSTGRVEERNKLTSPDERDQREIHLDADGAHKDNQSSKVLHRASGQNEENSAELESIHRQNKFNCVISHHVPFSAKMPVSTSELSVDPVAFTKELENKSFLSGEDMSSMKVQLVLEGQFDDLEGTRNADRNSVDTVEAADNLNNLSPDENKNITCAIGMQHKKSDYGLQSSNIAAEDAITRSNIIDNSQHTVHKAIKEKNRQDVHSSGYSSMFRIRTLEEQFPISEIDCRAGTSQVEENDRCNRWDTLFIEDRTVKEAQKDVNESKEEFQASEASVRVGGVNLSNISENPVKGRTVVFDEKGSQISQEEEGGALHAELESSSKDNEQESLEDISVIFPGEHTNMIKKHRVSMLSDGLGSEKHMPLCKHTAEETKRHEDGQAKLNAIEFNRCSMSISNEIMEQSLYGQEKESERATVIKTEILVSHPVHPIHCHEDNDDGTAKKEDQKERASDVVKEPLRFSQDCMEESMQGIASTQHGCMEENMQGTASTQHCLEEGNGIPRSGFSSACKETKFPVSCEILIKDATRLLCPEERRPAQGEEIPKSALPVHQASSLRTDSLLTGSDKLVMDDSTCEDVATAQMKSKSDEFCIGSVDITVLKAESNKENQQLPLGEFPLPGGNEMTKFNTKDAVEGNRELTPETRAANASEIICSDAIPLEVNKPTRSEFVVKEQHRAAEEAVELKLNSEIGLGAHHAVSEDNVHPDSLKELDLERHEGIFEERASEDVQSLESSCCHVNSLEASFHYVALEDEAVKRTQSSERSTQLKTPENKGGISPFNSDGCQQENPCYSCLEDEFKLHHDQAGKVAVSIRQTEWTQAHNSAAIKLDRCSMPCVAVESEWCTTDRVVMDANDVKGGNVNKTHEDTEDYSMNNHAMEMQKSEDGTNLRLSNLAPFSCPKDLRDLDGDIEAPPQCSEETNCDFDCQEDEEIQLDQHRYMHSYGLSCIKLRTRSAETNVGDESESSEESLLHDTGNPEIEDCVDVTNNDTALDSTGDTKYESDDLVRVEEDVPRKIDQSPVTAGEEPMLLRELSSDLKCKDQYSMEGSLLAERSEKIETGDESKAPTEDTVSNSTEKKSDGNEESGSNCVMTTELHDLSKLDGLPDSVSDPNRITCHADCLLKQGSRTGLPAILSAETSSNNETKLVEVHDKPQCQFDNPRKMIEHKHEKRLEDNIIGNDGDVTELEFDENAPLVAEGLENKHMEILEEHEKGLQDINAGDACDMVVLEFEENALLVSEGLEDEHKQKKAEESVDPIVPFDGFISAEKFEEHEKGLQDANAGYGGHLVALEFKENALLVAEEPGDEHKHNKAEEFVDPIAPLDWSSSGEKMQEYGKGLQDANAGDVVALEFEENSLLVAEGLTHEHKEVEESVNPNVSSDGFISGEKSEEHEKRLQDTSTEDGCHIVASEFKENALVVAEGLEDEHKEDKRAEESVAHLDGFISGEKLEEHDKVLQDANAGDGDVVASKFEENAPLVAEGLEYKHKEVEDSVNFNVPPDGYISVFGERLEDHEKRWEDVNAEDDGHVVALEFKENALLVAEGLEGEHKDKRAEETVDPTALVDGFISREKLEEHEKVLQVTNAGDGGDIVSSEFEENALLISEGPKDEHKHNQTEESTDPTAPSDGFILGEMLEEHEKRFQDTNAGDGGNVVALEFEENALLVAEGPEDEHKNKKAGECVNHIAPSDWFSSGEKLEEKEINNFRNEKRECPEDSVSYEGSVNKIKGRDAGALVEQESRSMTPLFGESELYSGMLNVEEHRIEEEVAEDIGSIKNSVDVLDLGGHEVSREQDDIYAMIQEYMDLEHQKADFGDIFVSQDIVHDDCGSYNAPTDKPIFESEQNESREEIPFHSAGADNSSLGDDGSIKHSIEQTTHLPIICTKNVNHDLAAMNISAMNDDDNMARKSSMKQPKFSSCQKNRSESNLDGSKKAALLMKSATVRRVKSRGNPIDKTPKKLLSTFEMKENMPSTKKEQISSTTATKTLTKRRALEDLRKKPIWK